MILRPKFAYVIAIDELFVPWARLLLRSLSKIQNKHDVVIFTKDVKSWDLLEKEAKGFRLVQKLTPAEIESVAEATDVYRYWGATELNYDAVAILDADMLVLTDFTLLFNIAKDGFAVVGGDGEGHFLSSPVVFGKSHRGWLREAYDIRKQVYIERALFEVSPKWAGTFLVLPPYRFKETHFWQVKPETGVKLVDGLLITGTEEEVYTLHGEWVLPNWVEEFTASAIRNAESHGFSGKYIECIRSSINAIVQVYNTINNLGEPIFGG